MIHRQLIHGRIRTVIMVLILAVVCLSGFYMKNQIEQAMVTMNEIRSMTETVSTLAEDATELTKNVSDTVAKLNTDEINTVITNMKDVSESLKGTVDALDIESLNTAVSNMNDVAENLNSVASLLNGAADALKGLFGKQ